MQFITINFSHFGELARWTLLASNEAFEEYNFSPGQHVLPALRVRVAGAKPYLNTSSRMFQKKDEASAAAVPVAVLPTGRVLLDSWDIARYCMPESSLQDELQKVLDTEIGPLGRQLFYLRALRNENQNVFDAMWEKDAGWFWRAAYACMKTGFVDMMREGVGFDQPNAMEDAVAKLSNAFAKVEREFMANLDGQYLGGDQPGLSDFALAAISAIVVFPKEYCGGRISQELDLLCEQDPDLGAIVTRFRATKLGQHCLLMYKLHRPAAPGCQTTS